MAKSCKRACGESLKQASRRPVTLLILLPAATRAWIVPPDLLPAHHLLRPTRSIAAEMQFRQFLLFLALDIAGEVLNTGLGRLALLLGDVGTLWSSLFFDGFFLVFIGERHDRTRAALDL